MGAGGVVLHANALTITDPAATVQIDPLSQAGMYDWFVDGQDYLAKQWFWYRVGATEERSIDTLTLLGTTPGPLAGAALLYTNATAGFDLKIDYTLNGTSPGVGSSDIDEQVRIQNYSDSTLSLSLFLYSDFNLDPGGDSVQEVVWKAQGSFSGYNRVVQTGGFVTQETIFGTRPTRAEVGQPGTLLSQLNDGSATVLPNTGISLGPIGPNDLAYVVQWDFNLAPGASVGIGIDKLIIVPEPTSLSLSLLGLAALWRATRRQRI
jgi:hypothetical protein